MNYVLTFLISSLAFSFGWFLAAAMMSNGLRDDLDELDRREEALNDAHRVLSARLLSTHVDHATHSPRVLS